MANENLGASFSIDISDLSRGLQQANRLIRESESEFRAASAGLDNWQNSEKGLTAKIKSLNQITDIQQKKVDALNAEYDKLVADGLDPASQKATELRTKINNETAALEKNRRQAEELSESLEEFRQKAEKTGKTVDEVATELKEMGDSAEDASDGFTTVKGAVATFAGNVLTGFVSKLGEAATSLMNLSAETQEYREDIGKLQTAFESAGHTTEEATKTYKELYSVFGEEDRAVEAAQQIANISKSEEDMARMTEIATGAWARWGDSLAAEALMESISHTSKLGEVQGNLSDALEWCGISVDDFNESLAKKNTEEKRTEYILSTLEGLYDDYAKNYKETNKNIIAARKSTSDYADVMADLGAEIEPVNAEVSGLKTELAKEFAPIVKQKVIPSVKDFIKKLKDYKVVEKFGDTLEFVTDNAGLLAGTVGSLILTFKGFAIVSGITTAVKGLHSAFIGLNATMAANPIGAVVTAVGLLATGLAALTIATRNSKDETNLRNIAAKETLDTVKNEAQAYNDLRTAQQEQAAADMGNIANAQRLQKELAKLVDENGNVKEANKARVDFILTELNNALGTEFTLTGNQIQGYKDLQAEIGKTILAKKAEILLAAQLPLYEEALTNYMDKQKEQARLSQELSAAAKAHDAVLAEIEATKAARDSTADARTRMMYDSQLTRLSGEETKTKETLTNLQSAYATNEEVLAQYYSDIGAYEEASQLLLEEKTAEAVLVLDSRNSAFKTAASVVKESAEDQKKILQQQVIDTEITARMMREKYEDGVEGVSEEMVEIAEEQARKAKEEFEKVGGEITKGIGEGAEEEKWSLGGTMSRIINSALAAAKKAAGIKSPAREFKKPVGGMIAAGVAEGVEDGTGSVVASVKQQVIAIKRAYDVDGLNGSLAAVKDSFAQARNISARSNKTAENGLANAGNGTQSVTVNQYNTYSQAHSRYEIWRSKEESAAAVKLALMGVK